MTSKPPDSGVEPPAGNTAPEYSASLIGKLKQRYISLALSCIMIFTVMAERHLGFWPFVWVALIYAVPWGLFLYLRLKHYDLRRVEYVEALVEHALAGFVTGAWLAFSLLPTAIAFSFLCAASLSKGGARLVAIGALLQIAGCVAGGWLAGWEWEIETSTTEILGCLPLLLLHPMLISHLTLTAWREVTRKQKQLELLSRTDGLTGLYNRSHWEAQVCAQFALCRRSQQSATLVLADLDHFKRINDVHGHAAGDQALRGFAGLLRANLRDIDISGRYGGEEFGILLPLASADQAKATIERLRDLMHDQSLLPQSSVTASFGIAEWCPAIDDPESWMRQADQMLYRAKHLGRNRICVAGETPRAVSRQPARFGAA
jgi:diguanylate cyclase (GGDEF)-like protein